MATNMLYKYTPALVREWPVPAGTQSGTAVLSAGFQPGVTLTARGDSTRAVRVIGLEGGEAVLQANGGVGNRADSATVATDGTFVFPVAGASGSTVKGTLVYAIVAGGAVTGLTLTVGTNKPFGVVDSYPGKATAAATAVKIGVFA